MYICTSLGVQRVKESIALIIDKLQQFEFYVINTNAYFEV